MKRLDYPDGITKTSIYKRWVSMRRRCYNKLDWSYKYYGGRGITVCDEWHEFMTYYEYMKQLKNYMKKGYTIDRINNDGNYEPGNIRWVDYKVQNNNRRRKHHNINNEITGLRLKLQKSVKNMIQIS